MHADPMNALVLGPLLRHVDEESACIWVETSDAGTVRIEAGGASGEVRTFGVHGHHYALVCVDGLEKGTKYPYTVSIDGARVWPPEDSPYPPSLIPTLDNSKPLRMAFGSCRTSVTHDEEGNNTHGVDALRAYALRMAGVTDTSADDDPDPGDEVRWPDVVLFLGDQVYADETTEEMQEFIESRRDIEQPPWKELKDYEEYAHLYRLAWTDPANRWLLSTVPIGDDLRRPRHPRRLEHLAAVEGRDGGHLVVARTDRRRAGVVLGLPAPRQHDALRARRGRGVAAHRRAPRRRRDRPVRRARRVRGPGRPEAGDATAGAMPGSTATRRGWSSWTRARPGCWTPTTARSSTTARWPGSTSRCAATSSTC